MLCPLRKEGKCTRLCRFTCKSSVHLLRDHTRRIELLVAHLGSLVCMVFLANQMIAQELFHARLCTRQDMTQLCHSLWSMHAQMLIDGMRCPIRKDGMICILLRRVDREDAQAALARHEETHHLCRRTEVEICQFLRRRKQHRREPCLLIHRPDDRAQLMCAVTRRIIRAHADNESLHAHTSERDKHTPACIQLHQLIRHTIGECTGNALDRNVDIDISNGHSFPFSAKKPLHEHIRATAPFIDHGYEANAP